MRGVNKVILVGNLGRDPEVTYLEGGTARANFTLATNEGYTDRNGNRVDQTEWHNIVFWRKQAEIAEKYLRKGSKIYMEGKIRSFTWEDNGVKKTKVEIVGDNFIMLDRKDEAPGGGGSSSYSGSNSGGGYQQSQQQQPQQTPQNAPSGGGQSSGNDSNDSYEDDLPF